MIKVFEDFNFSLVGRMQSLLESHGIDTFLKNEFGSSVVGELPFVEVVPQLYIIEDRDLERATALLAAEAEQPADSPDWVCPDCKVEVEGVFDRCWNCGKPGP